MATTATPWKVSHSHSQSVPRTSRPLTTPRVNHPTLSPTTQIKTPIPSNVKSPNMKDTKSPSPSYFGFVVGDDSIPGDSGPGPHVRQNWTETATSGSRNSNSQRMPDFELFRRQSEKNIGFSLNNLPQSRPSLEASPQIQNADSPASPKDAGSKRNPLESEITKSKSGPPENNPFFLGIQRHDSPMSLSPRNSITDERQPRLSLPAHELQPSLAALKTQRSDTLPIQPFKEVHAMVTPQDVSKILDQHPEQSLVLDLRVAPQYAASRVRGALNLCIPTMLLKRPVLTATKLADTFASDADKTKFNKWRDCKYIVVYDATSSLAKEAITSFHVLKKFNTEGWKGYGYVIKGGFAAVQKLTPGLVEQGNKSNMHPSGPSTSDNPADQIKVPVAGGCAMPATKNAANPFFNNIRQNQDLIDGVGQIPIKKPAGIQAVQTKLPTWLRKAASTSNEGKDVSNKFLHIEKAEQKRMQKALSTSVSYGTPTAERAEKKDIQVAGIEKGSKNRYNNIFPFEHSRVRLQGVPSHGCDYVNASYVKASYSNRRYIATQAPIPQTFDDFWRVVWEQDARVIVMLTAESEGGQVKSHAYWNTGNYGSCKVKLTAEQKLSLSKNFGHIKGDSSRKTGSGRRLTTSNATPALEKKFNFAPVDVKSAAKPSEEEPSVIVRRFEVSHSSQATQRPRLVTQVQYTQWPDFGAPASPTSILNLIELVDRFQREVTTPANANAPNEPAKERQRPIVVHCSAGCGRTGTFCTIDSVIDMMKRQNLEGKRSPDDMDIDSEDDWVKRDDVDLIAKAVEDFRYQRLSMVQNLRQFVLCYESILQWVYEQNSTK